MKIDVTGHKGQFFTILAETDKSQIGVMTIKPGQDSGPEEIHSGDQIVYVIDGEAQVRLNGEEGKVISGQALIIPAGAQHHIYNCGQNQLFFLTIYAPPSY